MCPTSVSKRYGLSFMDFEDCQQHTYFPHFLLISLTRAIKAFLFSLEPFFQPDHAQNIYSSIFQHCHQHPTEPEHISSILHPMDTFEICPKYQWHVNPLCLWLCFCLGLPKAQPSPVALQGPAKAAVRSLWDSCLSSPAPPWVTHHRQPRLLSQGRSPLL